MSQKISNIKRLRQIANSFVKHGLGHLVKLTGLDTYISVGKRLLLVKEAEEKVEYTNPQRMVMVFQELGPTFIKLGQILSTRKDQLPREYIVEFEKLQDNVPPMPFAKMDLVFEADFGKTTEEAFDYIDRTAMASGSIGQVHTARLKTGEKVVVKIRKPGIEHIINADLKILDFLAHQIEKIAVREDAIFKPVEIVKEFETIIKRELDFVTEGRNIERFQHNFRDDPKVHFPEVHWDYSSPRVLVMEQIDGIPIGDIKRLRDSGHDLKKIAGELFQLTLKQMFVDAFFHADPHPGNFIIMENGAIGIIDCGMVGFMEEYFVNAFIDCFAGLFLKDYDLVVRGYMDVGTITKEIDTGAFKNDIRNFAEHYMNISLDTISIGTLLDDAIDVGVRNKMKIPAAMLVTSKVLVTVEGTIRKIDPAFDFVGHSTEFSKTLIVKKKFDLKKFASDILIFVSGMSNLFQALPRQTSKILTMVEEQEVTLNVKILGLEDLVRKVSSLAR